MHSLEDDDDDDVLSTGYRNLLDHPRYTRRRSDQSMERGRLVKMLGPVCVVCVVCNPPHEQP